ncbi:MAG: hypothetical protein IT513_09830 [Burkholderiales bacterium]|nr:hypothetical protein [Burkholderiales bacterium]
MLRRARILTFAKFVLAALLFAQATLAAAGCDLGQRSAAQAVAAVGEAPCPDHRSQDTREVNPNLCLIHCTSDAQNVDTNGPALQSLSAIAVLTVAAEPAVGKLTSFRSASTNYAFAAPPVRILIHNLRI